LGRAARRAGWFTGCNFGKAAKKTDAVTDGLDAHLTELPFGQEGEVDTEDLM
jgi:hypothetical protein